MRVSVREFPAGTVMEESTRMEGTFFSTGGAGGVKAGTSSESGMKVRALRAIDSDLATAVPSSGAAKTREKLQTEATATHETCTELDVFINVRTLERGESTATS